MFAIMYNNIANCTPNIKLTKIAMPLLLLVVKMTATLSHLYTRQKNDTKTNSLEREYLMII